MFPKGPGWKRVNYHDLPNKWIKSKRPKLNKIGEYKIYNGKKFQYILQHNPREKYNYDYYQRYKPKVKHMNVIKKIKKTFNSNETLKNNYLYLLILLIIGHWCFNPKIDGIVFLIEVVLLSLIVSQKLIIRMNKLNLTNDLTLWGLRIVCAIYLIINLLFGFSALFVLSISMASETAICAVVFWIICAIGVSAFGMFKFNRRYDKTFFLR